jgi:hypothetical protein
MHSSPLGARVALAFAFGLGAVAPSSACATGVDATTTVEPAEPSAPDHAAGTDAASDESAPSAPSPAPDAAPDVVEGRCHVQRVAKSRDCVRPDGTDDHACDARLTLPAGDVYCTFQCARASDCDGLGADLVCPPEVGACTPRCTGDATCKAGGFKRCDLTAGGCDTL